MGVRSADEVLSESWERYAREAIAAAGQDYPGRERVVELFGEPLEFGEVVAPFGERWPGLAPAAGELGADAEEIAERVAVRVHAGLRQEELTFLLDRPYRSEDVPRLLDELGLAGGWLFETEELRVILRSWEERYGARLVALDGDRLAVSVAAPPRTPAQAEAVAAEHFAFSSDTITQGDDETLRDYAANQVLDHEVWSFWWD